VLTTHESNSCHKKQFRTKLCYVSPHNQLPLHAAYNPRIKQVPEHVQFQCVFPTGECQMMLYKWVLLLNVRKHCPVLKSPPRSRDWSCFPTQQLCIGSRVHSTLHPSSFAKLDIRGWYCIGLYSFKMSSLLNHSILGSKAPSSLHPSSFTKLDIRGW
jgi:hypothetical protein